MTDPNLQRVQTAQRIVHQALPPFVAREMRATWKKDWFSRIYYAFGDRVSGLPKDGDEQDLADNLDFSQLLLVIDQNWNEVFRRVLPQHLRSHIHEMRHYRNTTAHAKAADLDPDETYRALDTMFRFLEAFDTKSAKAVRSLRSQAQAATAPVASAAAGVPSSPLPGGEGPGVTATTTPTPTPISPSIRPSVSPSQTAKPRQSGLSLTPRPWRDVIEPHPDVRGGSFQAAEYAADLAEVLAGRAEDDYQDAAQFFARTYLTEGMRRLLASGVQRIVGAGGDPIIQLKTAFGGGKTHTMIALYHLLQAGELAASLPGVGGVLAQAEVAAADLPSARVAVLVGTDLNPTQPWRAAGSNIEVRTLWGEMAAQLGGPEGYALVESADRSAVPPGAATLIELFERHGPAVVMIDEFVAYARTIYGKTDLPSGTFDANLSFVQQLTEAVKRAGNALLVISIPASEKELGGDAGKEAQQRLEHTVGRVDTVWQPVQAQEGFEVVRRRLFGDVADADARDAVCDRFAKLYRDKADQFTAAAAERDYYQRLQAAYPFHPELFDRLYGEWATLPEFQRTRGVLKLMAGVVHVLWEQQSAGWLIMPGDLPMEHAMVRAEMTRYLQPEWNSVVDQDVIGRPLEIDRTQGRYGKIGASKRLARAIFLGSAPAVSQEAAHGVAQAGVLLGVVQPEETVADYADALRKMADESTYLFSDGRRYRYDIRPNLNRTAEERARAIEPYLVREEIRRRLSTSAKGGFAGVHVFADAADVPDTQDVRLVVLPPTAGHRKTGASAADAAAHAILQQRGGSPRQHKNMVVLVAPNEPDVEPLELAVRQALAWKGICEEWESLNLDASSKRQAEANQTRAEEVAKRKLAETYRWLLAPRQDDQTSAWSMEPHDISGAEALPDRAAAALRQSGDLVPQWSPMGIRVELDRWFWQRLAVDSGGAAGAEAPEAAEAVELGRLWDALTSYGYLPRLTGQQVLLDAIVAGLPSPDFFAYAASRDKDGRYLGLVYNKPALTSSIVVDRYSLLVTPATAHAQDERDNALKPPPPGPGPTPPPPGPGPVQPPIDPPIVPPPPPPATQVTRYAGRATLGSTMPASQVQTIASQIIAPLLRLNGASVDITIHIDAHVPGGVPPDTLRAVSEDSRTLHITFELETD